MIAIILTIHTMIVLALVVVVLLQRSEGGALGMGGGGGGFMSGRGAATALTRTTTVLGGLFFLTSLSLALVADRGEENFDFLPGQENGTPDLEDDDFSDIVGVPEDDAAGEAPATDPGAFELPETLGTEDAPAQEPVEAEGDETPPAEGEQPQR